MQLNKTFFIIFGLISLPELLGLPNGRIISFWLIIVFSVLIIISDVTYRRRIEVPKPLFVIYIIFIIFSILSALFGDNPLNSAKVIGLYFSGFLFFIYAYNHRLELSKAFQNFILLASFVFIFYSVFLFFYQGKLLPSNGYQFVYSKFGSHNHLGDFLVLSIIICAVNIFKKGKKRYFFILIPSIIFFIFSYSRSAYLSLIITSSNLVFYLKQTKKALFFLVPLILFLIFFSFATVKQNDRGLWILKQSNLFLRQNLHLNQKYLLATRPEYTRQAILGIKETPIWGYGPGNFIHLSRKYAHKGSKTDSSHNIFLDVWSENGIFSLILFSLFVSIILKSSLKKPSILSFLFLAFFIIFQVDYIFRIYSFLILFIVLGALVYNPKE